MDFLKVLDQTVRELKREVNLKVLNIPEMEQKVMDATDDEPWGPHGTALAEIAVGTKKFTDCQLIMDVLWTRLSETDKNWRCVYKALAVIEYLVSHGSVRAVDDIIEHTYQISTLSRFEYVEPSGKDMGINVRKKAENIVALLNNKDKIQEVRNKAAANRDKYIGLSSSDVRSKSGVNSLSSSSFKSNERYGGFGSTSDDEYKFGRSSSARSRREVDSGNSSKKGTSQDDRKRPVTSASKTTMKVNEPDKNASNSRSSVAPSKIYEDDDDDFDPRGTSSAKPSAGSTNQVEDLFDPWNTSNAKPSTGSTNEVDLFGKNSVDDLLSVAPAPVSVNKPNAKSNPSEIDLFANDGFGSAISQPGFESSGSQNNVDLFASQSAPCAVSSTNNVDLFAFQSTPSKVSPTIDLFATPDNNTSSNTKQMNNSIVDPFASVPLNNFDGPDPFGGAFTSPSQASQTPSNLNGLSVDSKSSANKDTFQVKSDVWADSLSRGLFDLNITAPKSANLADVGIVGSADGSDSFFMGGPTGAGSAIGNPGNSSTSTGMDDLFSSLSNEQYQFGSFKK